MNCINHRLIVSAACGFLLVASAGAQNLVSNGGFENTTKGSNKQLGYNTKAVGWATTSFSLIYAPGAADTTGASSQYGNVKLWGINDGGLSEITASPNGGNFISTDGAFNAAPITQTLSGLTIGNQYEVSFYWAAAQEYGYDGSSTENWQVSLGGQTMTTPTVTLPSHGFSGWMSQTFTFTSDSVNPVLSFLAYGAPSGQPPYSLLDGVSVVAVPEASTCLMGAIFCFGMTLRRKRSC